MKGAAVAFAADSMDAAEATGSCVGSVDVGEVRRFRWDRARIYS